VASITQLWTWLSAALVAICMPVEPPAEPRAQPEKEPVPAKFGYPLDRAHALPRTAEGARELP
jgi:hypothetical protein